MCVFDALTRQKAERHADRSDPDVEE